jgi:cellobiose phosphorylase
MAAVDRELILHHDGLALLFTPPFDRLPLDPGYIKGYPPGVRENGGQYTHAAVWASMAFAGLGDSVRAWELLRLINPVNHGNATTIEQYKVEPYVLSADVYGVAPHAGRGDLQCARDRTAARLGTVAWLVAAEIGECGHACRPRPCC